MTNLLINHSIIQPSCCFVGVVVPDRSSTPSLVKSYSQPKYSKDKKITLSINKRGHSQDKSSGGISLSKNIKNQQSNSHRNIKNNVQITNATSNPSSKINSLSNSRTNCNKNLKIQRNNSKQIKTYPLKSQITFQQTRIDSSNLHMPSDITYVEQEFISHGSTTLNALNYLNNQLERSKMNQIANGTVKLISNYPMKQDTIKQFKNPLQKLAEKRKVQTKNKLVL